MKKIISLTFILALVGCAQAPEVYPVNAPVCPEGQVCEIENIIACKTPDCSDVLFDTPNGNDLLLETDNHIIHINAEPNKSYIYYVWVGDKDMTADPDLIVEDGIAAVLVEE